MILHFNIKNCCSNFTANTKTKTTHLNSHNNQLDTCERADDQRGRLTG